MTVTTPSVNSKEELSASTNVGDHPVPSFHNLTFPTGFKVLSEAERTATLYSLLRHSTQVTIRFFITVLQQGLSHDCSSETGSRGFMQNQMGAKLASMTLKFPRLKSNMPGFPSACTLNSSATNRQLLAFDSSSSLAPDSANSVGDPSDATASFAQHRAKLKAASNAPIVYLLRLSPRAQESAVHGPASVPLGQVVEPDNSPTSDIFVETRSSHPQSTDFSALFNSPAFCSPRPGSVASLDELSPTMVDRWEHGEQAAPAYFPEAVVTRCGQ